MDVPEEFAARVRCGVLTVPESHAEGSDPTRTIQLPVAVIASSSDNPAPDPLVFPTTGGPGGTTLGALEHWLYDADWALNERDLILVTQRGTEYAEPALYCPEYDAEADAALQRIESADARVAALVRGAQACRDRLTAEGVNLSAYTSAESAADLADLRTALGYDQWNVYGISYGGRLALTVMRDHPEGLRSVILDSAYTPTLNRYEAVPPSFANAVDTLFAGCAADPECGTLYPNLETEFYAIVERFNGAPLPVEVKDHAGSSVTLQLTGDDITGGLFNALYDSEQIRVLPFVIHEIYGGNTSVVEPLAQQNFTSSGFDSAGMGFSVECYEEMPFNRPEAIAQAYAAHPALASFAGFDEFPAVCALWGVAAAPPIETEPVVSDIPTLLVTGQYDPIHPRFWSDAAAETLSHHYLYDFPAMGHGVVWQSWFDNCPASMAGAFIHDPLSEPDGSCIASMHAPDFLTSNDITVTPAIYRLNSRVIEGGEPLQIGVLAFGLMALVIGLIYSVISLMARRSKVPLSAAIFALLAAALNLAFVVGLVLVLFNADFLILGFGLPTSARPLLILPLVGLGATIILIVLVARAWLRRSGRGFDRAILSLAALGGLVFAGWLASLGLLML
jgi:pimeloyl-ACP methyl ester carboxylesterase